MTEVKQGWKKNILIIMPQSVRNPWWLFSWNYENCDCSTLQHRSVTDIDKHRHPSKQTKKVRKYIARPQPMDETLPSCI